MRYPKSRRINKESNIMSKKTKSLIIIIALIIYAIIIGICVINSLYSAALVLGALFIILAVCLGIYIREEPDEFSVFIKNRRRILKTYNSIIVEVEDIVVARIVHQRFIPIRYILIEDARGKMYGVQPVNEEGFLKEIKKRKNNEI